MAVERIGAGSKVQRFTGKLFRFVDLRRGASEPLHGRSANRMLRRDRRCLPTRARADPRLGFFVASLFIDRVCKFRRSSCEDSGLPMLLQCGAGLSERLFSELWSSGEHFDCPAEPQVGVGIESQLLVSVASA